MKSGPRCEQCGVRDKLLLCSRCRKVYYCCKEHQTKDWRRHKLACATVNVAPVSYYSLNNTNDKSLLSENVKSPVNTSRFGVKKSVSTSERNTSPITFEGSSEQEITSARTEVLSPNINFDTVRTTSPSSSCVKKMSYFQEGTLSDILITEDNTLALKDFSEIRLDNNYTMPPFLHKNKGDEQDIMEEVCRNVIKDMDAYGVCVVDNFLGREKGMAVLEEVIQMYETGVFKDGQLVSTKVKKDLKTIRSDQITWIDGTEPLCKNIDMLISKVDTIIMTANRMSNNGKMGDFTINGRTKAMVACYPGRGSHYVKHVDNPNKDGRCITAIYYLNKDWDITQNGGLLRIFPEGWRDQVADIEPLFDRILFFWSDRRNPHEVQPAYKTRYAITLWYFDATEREEACKRYQRDSKLS